MRQLLRALFVVTSAALAWAAVIVNGIAPLTPVAWLLVLMGIAQFVASLLREDRR